MIERTQNLALVEPGERLALRVGASTLYYRRLSLGALAALERQQAELLTPARGGRATLWLPPKALEAAICAHVLVGWDGVSDVQGRRAPFSQEAAARLPAKVRALVVGLAQQIETRQGD